MLASTSCSNKFILKKVLNSNLRKLSSTPYRNLLKFNKIFKKNSTLLCNDLPIESSLINSNFTQNNFSFVKFYCTPNKNMSTEVKPELTEIKNLSTKDKFKKAIKEYGSTVIVFHVTISLMSLGFFYLLVSSGVDVIAILNWMGINTSTFLAGTSTFVLAYAIHKVFAPVRMGITLGATPIIVRYLREKKVLK